MKVFISYSSGDVYTAQHIRDGLEEIGCDTFLDENVLRTGDSIIESIKRHLAESDHFLLLLSPFSMKSHWVMVELGGAIALDKRVVPILLCMEQDDVPDVLNITLARKIADIQKYFSEIAPEAGGGAARTGDARQLAEATIHDVVRICGTYANYTHDRAQLGRGFTVTGAGQLGGKGKALAYVHERLPLHDGLDERVRIPPTVVISDDDFDEVCRPVLGDREREWSQADVLERIGGVGLSDEIRTALEPMLELDRPLIVRSSSRLEGGLLHSFSGIYRSFWVGVARDPQVRLEALQRAVRTVQSDVWSRDAVAYRLNRGLEAVQERMAVIVQPAVGRWVHDGFYPLASGIGQSRNFYPWNEKGEAGSLFRFVYGLGTRAVGRDSACTVAPGAGRLAQYVRDGDDMTGLFQTRFDHLTRDDDGLTSSDLSQALGLDPEARVVGEYFDGASYRVFNKLKPDMYDSVHLTFGPLLDLPPFGPKGEGLEQVMKELKAVFENDVEIEFAFASTDDGRLDLLQVRPLEVIEDRVHLPEPVVAEDRIVVKSSFALGNRLVEGVERIVYVDEACFRTVPHPRIQQEIAAINALSGDAPYILLGPGWWGTEQRGLGVQVSYADIFNACAIVENLVGTGTPPSYGGHFITNIINEGIPLLSVGADDLLRSDWLDAIEASRGEPGGVRVLDVPTGVNVHVDGYAREGMIFVGEAG